MKARLTMDGEVQKREVEADPKGACLIPASVHENPIRGRAALRITSNEAAAPGVVQEEAGNENATPKAPPFDPGDGWVDPSPPSGSKPLEAAKPPAKGKRRGRTAGVNKIDMALTELSARLKDGRPTTILALAQAVGCHTDNLKRSDRFMKSYRELTDAMARVPKYKGSKTDGVMEAWVDPRGDQDEIEADF